MVNHQQNLFIRRMLEDQNRVEQQSSTQPSAQVANICRPTNSLLLQLCSICCKWYVSIRATTDEKDSRRSERVSDGCHRTVDLEVIGLTMAAH
jgi:hypothetical protein